MRTTGTASTQAATSMPGHLQRRPANAILLETDDPRSLIFVDFDHTLFAGNSTEFFLAAAKPSLAAALIEFIIRGCMPWRLTGLRNWFRVRDYLCVLAVIALCPGSLARWKRDAPALFQKHLSQEVADALRSSGTGQMVIITFGMAVVVKALLRGSAWSTLPVIATPTFGFLSHLSRGKRDLATRYAGQKTVASATFITDSLDDEDLLAAVKSGFLIEAQGDPASARERLYLPLRYTAVAKYTRSYVADQLILVELFLLLASTSRNPGEFLVHCSFVPVLFLSIICIYEIGYFENDMKAAGLERAPTLKEEAVRFRSYPITPGAWVWAIAAGVLGNGVACAARHVPAAALLWRVPGWITGLIVLRLVFHIYNRPDLRIRLHLYPVLQLLKFLAILLVVPPTPLGAVMVLCQITAMWAIYLTYRHGGRTRDIERELLRVVLLGIGIVLLVTTRTDDQAGRSFQLAAAGLWALCRLAKAPALARLRRPRPT